MHAVLKKGILNFTVSFGSVRLGMSLTNADQAASMIARFILNSKFCFSLRKASLKFYLQKALSPSEINAKHVSRKMDAN